MRKHTNVFRQERGIQVRGKEVTAEDRRRRWRRIHKLVQNSS